MDTGFYMWSFQGKPLYRSPAHLEKFCQFLWRPRPPSLLTEEDIKTIRKEHKKYHHMFEQKDRSIKSKASKVSASTLVVVTVLLLLLLLLMMMMRFVVWFVG